MSFHFYRHTQYNIILTRTQYTIYSYVGSRSSGSGGGDGGGRADGGGGGGRPISVSIINNITVLIVEKILLLIHCKQTSYDFFPP